MLYRTVRIRPSFRNKDEWDVIFHDMPGDRENQQAAPHPLGFYHHPRRKPKRKAFEELKALLVSKHKEEIEKLTKSLAKLAMLEFKE